MQCSRHPARRLTDVMKPRMQRRPIDAEVRPRQMLREDQRRDENQGATYVSWR